MTNHVAEAIQRAGGGSKLAKTLGLSRSRISQWQKAKRVSPKYCVKIERLTGVSRHKLCPDVFGKEPPRPKDGEPPPRPKTSVPRPKEAAPAAA